MNRRTFALIGLLLCSTAYAAGTSIWNATDRGTVAATDRLPVATSSSNGPLYVTPLTLQSYLLSSSATTEVLANNTGSFDGDSGFTFNATNNSVDLGGATLTASDPVLDLSQTWNNAGVTFTGLKFNVTATASAAASLLADFQVGGTPIFSITRPGVVLLPTGTGASALGVSFQGDTNTGFYVPSADTIKIATGGSERAVFASTIELVAPITGNASVLEIRNGTSAQKSRIYNTYTDASNYERLSLVPGAAAGWMQVKAETAGTGTDNINVALTPAGTGGVSAQVPDSTAAGGNARGTYAVDWQLSRAAAADVAAGPYSVVSGGLSNEINASHDYGVISGGNANGIYGTGNNSFIGGGGTNSINNNGDYNTIAGGGLNIASANYGFVGGGSSNTVSGQSAVVVGGSANTASGSYSWIPGGWQATTRGLIGAGAYSSGQRAASGDAQVILQPVRATTTDATPVSLATNGTPAAATVMVLPSDSTATCESIVTANSTAAGVVSMAGFRADAIVKNDSSTMTISGGTCTAIGTADAALTTATCALVANGTLDSIEMQVTGVAATTVYWVAEVKCVQAL